jgi:hypothetical protein
MPNPLDVLADHLRASPAEKLGQKVATPDYQSIARTALRI